MISALTPHELAVKLNMDQEALQTTLGRYNEFVAQQKDEDFGRTTALRHPLNKGPYYATRIAPGSTTRWAASPSTPIPRCSTRRSR